MTIAFKAGEKITRYDGEIVNPRTLVRRYGGSTPPYCMEYGENYIDGACKRGVANYANHKADSRANATFSAYFDRETGNDEIMIKAKKHIYHGQEIFVSYGPEYQLGECRHTTK